MIHVKLYDSNNEDDVLQLKIDNQSDPMYCALVEIKQKLRAYHKHGMDLNKFGKIENISEQCQEIVQEVIDKIYEEFIEEIKEVHLDF